MQFGRQFSIIQITGRRKLEWKWKSCWVRYLNARICWSKTIDRQQVPAHFVGTLWLLLETTDRSMWSSSPVQGRPVILHGKLGCHPFTGLKQSEQGGTCTKLSKTSTDFRMRHHGCRQMEGRHSSSWSWAEWGASTEKPLIFHSLLPNDRPVGLV